MRTCPHMSPGCSSPWDLNIAPARHYCCHSQTYSDLLTSPTQKRLDADTFPANVFSHFHIAQEQPEQAHRFKTLFSGDYQRAVRHSLFSLFIWLLFEVSCDWLEAGRWLVARTTIGQSDVSQHLARGRRSEFAGHLLVLSFSSDTLVLQAAARPRVGSVFLHTNHFLSTDTWLLIFLITCIFF